MIGLKQYNNNNTNIIKFCNRERPRNIKIKNMISSYMGRQKTYCICFENDNYIELEKSIIRNIYRNINEYDNEPKLLVKYCKKCIYKFNDKHIEYFISRKFNFPELDNFLE